MVRGRALEPQIRRQLGAVVRTFGAGLKPPQECVPLDEAGAHARPDEQVPRHPGGLRRGLVLHGYTVPSAGGWPLVEAVLPFVVLQLRRTPG